MCPRVSQKAQENRNKRLAHIGIKTSIYGLKNFPPNTLTFYFHFPPSLGQTPIHIHYYYTQPNHVAFTRLPRDPWFLLEYAGVYTEPASVFSQLLSKMKLIMAIWTQKYPRAYTQKTPNHFFQQKTLTTLYQA